MHDARRPLVDIAEGRDQDDRGDLYLAFKRCAQWRKTTQTNLHVRELLLYVMATDRDRRGVQKSYTEIADRLELCSERAARHVIARAKEFGLLVITEARYERGGQSANRYSINWPFVRAIRDGLENGNPWPKQPAIEPENTLLPPHEPGDTQCQAGDTQCHPYKEHSRTVSRTGNYKSISNTPPKSVGALSASSANATSLQEEESLDCEERSLGNQPDATGSRPLTPTDHARFSRLVIAYGNAGVYSADALLGPLAHTVGIDHLEQLLAVWERSGDAWGAGALTLRLRRARPQLNVSDGWPPPRRQRAADIPVTFVGGNPFQP